MFSSINPKSGDHFVISDNSPAAFGRMIGAEFDCLRDTLVQLPDCPPMNYCFLIKSDNVPAALETAEKLITSIRRTAQPVFIEKLLGDIAGVQPNRYPVCSDERISRLQDMADHKEMPMIFTAGADTGFEKYNNCGIAAAIMAPEVCTYTDDSAAATVIEACENNYTLLDICRPTPENIRRNAFIKLRMAYSCTSEEKLGQLAGMIAEAVCSSDEYISGMIRNMRDADRLIGKELSRLGSADVCGDDDDEEEYYEEEYYEEAGEEDPFGDVFGDIPEITPMPTGFGGFFGGMPAGTNEHKKIPVKVQTIDELVDPGDKKEKLESIVNSLRLEMEMSGDGHMTDGYNVIFAGNPGCGKTTVARAFAKMLEEAGIVPENSFVELKKSDYVGMVVGETEKLIDSNYERHAAGAVFFYDEAYVLSSEQRTVFEQEAYDTILSNMENYRGRIINIFAGYKDLMNRFADCNAGMRCRTVVMPRKTISTVRLMSGNNSQKYSINAQGYGHYNSFGGMMFGPGLMAGGNVSFDLVSLPDVAAGGVIIEADSIADLRFPEQCAEIFNLKLKECNMEEIDLTKYDQALQHFEIGSSRSLRTVKLGGIGSCCFYATDLEQLESISIQAEMLSHATIDLRGLGQPKVRIYIDSDFDSSFGWYPPDPADGYPHTDVDIIIAASELSEIELVRRKNTKIGLTLNGGTANIRQVII